MLMTIKWLQHRTTCVPSGWRGAAGLRLGGLSQFSQLELDCACPVPTVVACRFPAVSTQIFTRWLRASFGLKHGGGLRRENAAVSHCRGKLFRQRGFGTLSSQLMSLSEIDGLQQFPGLKTGPREKAERGWFQKEFYLLRKNNIFNN